MSKTNISSEKSEESVTIAYSAPHLVDYGPVSELTKTDASGVGFDGGDTPSSYIS
ncbi:MAG: lasso RiPP family leader peptide-containing protein [Parasphingorhabdus sp.]|uniref:lasso RiPP family leader peptide-containing protein n=1 Tax=Parasphingorhabdus sp. TaxID=2709688 RepID=UPI0032664BFC